MKMKLVTIAMGLTLIGTQAHASALRIVGGACRFEASQERIAVRNIDPTRNFGKFAQGSTTDGAHVYLTQNIRNSVLINISGKTGSAYSIVALSQSGDTRVRIGA